jgi:hypothetical protein
VEREGCCDRDVIGQVNTGSAAKEFLRRPFFNEKEKWGGGDLSGWFTLWLQRPMPSVSLQNFQFELLLQI